MNAELFFVAFYKHGAPQYIVSGPYVEQSAAQDEIDTNHDKDRLVVVKIDLGPVEVVEGQVG